MPKVSVIMNCYNGERYLREAIESVYAQTFDDWEIIFWDNWSTDSSAEIAKNYDSRLLYYKSDKFTTLGAARRLALEKANGDWVGFLDCDDLWMPDKLETQMGFIEKSDFVISYGGMIEIAENERKIREVIPLHKTGYQLMDQLNQFEMHLVTAMVSNQALKMYHLTFDDNVTASEEYNLFMRLVAKGAVNVIARPIAYYRVYDSSLSTKNMSRWASERRYTLEQLESENPGVKLKYPAEFKEALARASYYDARYAYHIGDVQSAKSSMRGIAKLNYRYRLLYFSLYIPFLWGVVHRNLIKRILLPKIFRIVG